MLTPTTTMIEVGKVYCQLHYLLARRHCSVRKLTYKLGSSAGIRLAGMGEMSVMTMPIVIR